VAPHVSDGGAPIPAGHAPIPERCAPIPERCAPIPERNAPIPERNAEIVERAGQGAANRGFVPVIRGLAEGSHVGAEHGQAASPDPGVADLVANLDAAVAGAIEVHGEDVRAREGHGAGAGRAPAWSRAFPEALVAHGADVVHASLELALQAIEQRAVEETVLPE
jgi:hypothetical protein